MIMLFLLEVGLCFRKSKHHTVFVYETNNIDDWIFQKPKSWEYFLSPRPSAALLGGPWVSELSLKKSLARSCAP